MADVAAYLAGADEQPCTALAQEHGRSLGDLVRAGGLLLERGWAFRAMRRALGFAAVSLRAAATWLRLATARPAAMRVRVSPRGGAHSMPMISCQSCGAPVREGAVMCPRCGKPVQLPQPWVWWALLVVFMGAASLYMFSQYP